MFVDGKEVRMGKNNYLQEGAFFIIKKETLKKIAAPEGGRVSKFEP